MRILGSRRIQVCGYMSRTGRHRPPLFLKFAPILPKATPNVPHFRTKCSGLSHLTKANTANDNTLRETINIYDIQLL